MSLDKISGLIKGERCVTSDEELDWPPTARDEARRTITGEEEEAYKNYEYKNRSWCFEINAQLARLSNPF